MTLLIGPSINSVLVVKEVNIIIFHESILSSITKDTVILCTKKEKMLPVKL